MSGRWYRASWTLPDGTQSYSEIWSDNLSSARLIAERFGFSPVRAASTPVTEYRPSRLAELQGGLGRADVMHSLCYLSTLAALAGVATAEQLVGDGSPLHELAHYLGAGGKIRGGKQLQFLMSRIVWLESIVPGMPPDDVILPVLKDIPGMHPPLPRGEEGATPP